MTNEAEGIYQMAGEVTLLDPADGHYLFTIETQACHDLNSVFLKPKPIQSDTPVISRQIAQRCQTWEQFNTVQRKFKITLQNWTI